MIDHVSLAVSDLERAVPFYERVFATLGMSRLVMRPAMVGFGKLYPEVWINLRRGMPRLSPDSGAHICLRAKSTDEIHAFHAAAIAAGATSESPPSLRDRALPKGDVLTVAKIAAIQAAKRTDELIPLCHSLPLDSVEVEFSLEDAAVRIRATVRTTAKTGVEMEALTAVSVAALTIYDMCKAVDKQMVIGEIRVTEKRKE